MAIKNYTTTINVNKTIGEIQELLSKHGATAIMTEYSNGNVTGEMVIIKNDTVIKKKFSVIDEDEVISFNLGNFLIAVRKEDLKKYL